ncbi:MAG: S8 family serine peptidase [Bacteroidales bacterium]
MKFRGYTILSLITALSIGGGIGSTGLNAQSPLRTQSPVATFKNGIRQGQILVKFKPDEAVLSEVKRAAAVSHLARTKGTTPEVITFESLPRVSRIANQIHASSITPLFDMNPKFEKRFKKEGLDRWFIIDFDSDDDPIAVMEALRSSGEVQFADLSGEISMPNYKTRPIYVPSALSLAKSSGIVSDPMFDQQWHYHNTGQTNGTPGSDINLVRAWEKRMNAEDVIVAVMDQGVDHQHEDIRANMWVNEAELYGTPGVDDDGNGQIDDIYGFDFGMGYGSIEKGEHGTHVAGTVAAVSNNGIGVAGVAGGDGSGNGARIMTLPVFGENNTRAANSFIYAADMGAIISQNSWGFSQPGFESDVWRDAIRYFVKYAGCDENGDQRPGSKMKGGLVIFAAGNDASSGLYFPGCIDEVIGVASLNHIDKPAFYTNYDTWVDVACYGGETSPRTEAGVLSTLPNNKYGYMDGTSMATPHVSGVACLAVAELGGDGFTSDMLFNYITLTTRNNDSNYEALYQGRMGSGIVDAVNAMTKNDGVPPLKIESVVGTNFADTYFRIMFNAPSKEDGTKVEGYKVNLKNTATQEVRTISFTSARYPGEQELLLVSGLKPETNYDVTVVSYDIWLTESPASETINVTTAKDKGSIGATQTLFLRNINVDETSSLSYNMTIRNSGEGALYWRADAYSRAFSRGQELFSLDNALNGLTKMSVNRNIDADTEIAGIYRSMGFKKLITYRQGSYPTRYIGEVRENGVTAPASGAVRFDVPEDMEEGFTLTHFDTGVDTSSKWLYDDQATSDKDYYISYEIYRGGDLPRVENRIYHSTFVRNYDDPLNIYLLPYKPHFEPGESFWIVVHTEAGLQYPLGVTEDATEAGHSFYSSNLGQTWENLDKVLPGTSSTFVLGAISLNDVKQSEIKLEPSSGYLNKGESMTLLVSIDAENLAEGTDSTNIVLSTDGYSVSGRTLVTSVLNVFRSDLNTYFAKDLYDYSTVSLGDSKDMRISFFNKGLANMPLDSVVLSNNSVFSFTSTSPKVLYSNDSVNVDVRFSPNTLGAANTQLKFYGRNRVDSILLIGTCVEAPSAEIGERVVNIPIKGNDKFTYDLQISNKSNYSLNYNFPKFVEVDRPSPNFDFWDDMSEPIDSIYADSTDHYTGYRWVDNNRGENYQGSAFIDISATGVELTNLVDNVQKNTRVRLPFAFPYYDRQVRDIWVGVNGTLVVDSTDFSAFNVPTLLPDYSYKVNGRPEPYKGLIAPLWMSDGSGGNFSKTRYFYQVMDDCIIFQFQGTKVYVIDSDKPAIFQAALYPNGEIEFRYKQVFDIPGVTANTFMVGWSSPDGLDGNTIWYMFRQFATIANSGDYSIKIMPPALSPFEKVESVNYKGIINPMGSKSIPVTIDPSLITPGNSSHSLTIETNDPLNKSVDVLFNFDKEDLPNIQFEQDAIDYGKLLYPSAIEKVVNIFNAAQSDQTVKLSFEKAGNVSFENGAKEMSITVKANSTSKFSIFLTGVVDNKIVSSSADGLTKFAEIAISSSSADYENVNLSMIDKESLSYNLAAGTTSSQTIRVTADAKSYKSNLFLPGFISAEEVGSNAKTNSTATRIDGNGYRWYNSASPEAPQFIWNDISKTGTRLMLEPHLDNPVINLPFTYKLYNVDSDVIYVSPSGRISYLPLPWDVFDSYITPRRMPNSDLEYPFVSAMWARQWYSSSNSEAGVYYDVNDERCIIQFHMFQYDWVITRGYTSYQIIVYKDGTIQFVYLDLEKCDLKDHITIGVQGEGGSSTRGYTYSLSSSTPIKSKTTITAKPMSGPYSIEAGKSVDLKLTANSYGFKAGDYVDSVMFVSENNQLVTKLPVTLSVSSNAKLQLKETEVDFGDIIVGEEVEPSIFTLMNSGNKDLTISSINYTNGGENYISIKTQELILDDNTGEFEEAFVDVEMPITIPVYGSEVYYLFFTPEDENKIYDIDMEFSTSNGDDRETLKVKAHSFKPAKLEVLSASGDSQMTVDLFNTTGSIYDKLKVEYKEGEGKVDFNLGYEVVNSTLEQNSKMRFTSPKLDNGITSQPVYIQRKAIEQSVAQSVASMPISSDAMAPYRNVSVIGDISPEAMIGAGSLGLHYGLSAFVKMNTGDTGFLMSHLKMWTNTLGRDTGYVEIRIYQDCPMPSREYLIYEKSHRYKMNVSLVGELTLPLEHDIAFAPNQEFWVEVYFGIKLDTPIAVATRPEEMTEIRNYYRLFNAKTGEWQPYQEYTNTLFAIWAVQESYSDLTKWFTVPSDQMEIGPNQTIESDVRMNRLHIPMGGSKLKVKANTKQLSEVKPLSLEVTKYKEPEWTDLPSKPLVIREGSEVSFFVKAVDDEGLPIEYSLKSPVDGVTLTPKDGGVMVNYKAPYTAGYVANLNIEARTTKGISIRRVSIGNVNVNRAPVAGDIKPINISLDPMNTSVVFSPYFFFVDPDGDYLQYSGSVNSYNLALNLSQNGFVFTPLSEGQADVVLTAYDGEFTVSNKFVVNVITPLVYAPIQSSPIGNRSVNTGESFSVDLSNHFYDLGGYDLTYEAWSTDENIGIASVSGSTVTVLTKNPGIAAVGIKVRNSEGGETTSSFAYRAVGEVSKEESNSIKSSLSIAPNPSRGLSVISFNAETLESGEYFYDVRDLAGKRIRTERLDFISEGDYVASLNVAGIQSGVYIVSIYKDGILITTERLVVVE